MKRTGLLALILVSVTLVYSCSKKEPEASGDNTPVADAKPHLPATTYDYFTKNFVSTPAADDKATLGRVLFYDKNLSLNNAIACASCHKQEFAFADNVQFSRGFENKQTGRNSMPIQNLFAGHRFTGGNDPLSNEAGMSLFWDGRSNSLMDLVMRPVANHIEMGIEDVNVIPAKLAKLDYYPPLFKKAFGTEEVTLEKVKQAMVMFMVAITSENTRFDAFTEKGISLNALELQGQSLFFNKYNCNNCHQVTVDGYSGISHTQMDIGLDSSYKDKGLGSITGNINDNGTFKIPNLRNVTLTAPYMHDGRFRSLDDVLDHYSKGIASSRNLDSRLKDNKGKPMRMNISKDEKAAIIAFLGTLTDPGMITDPKLSDLFQAN